MTTNQAVGERIRQLCEERNLSIRTLACHCGLPPTTIYSILNAKSKNPGVVNIKKICDGLHITLGEFFNTMEFEALEQELHSFSKYYTYQNNLESIAMHSKAFKLIAWKIKIYLIRIFVENSRLI